MTGLKSVIQRAYELYGLVSGSRLLEPEWFGLGVLLAGGDPRLKKLRLQWEGCGSFSRKAVSGGTLNIRWQFNCGCLGHAMFTKNTRSSTVAVLCEASGHVRLFTINVSAGGWCSSLESRRVDADELRNFENGEQDGMDELCIPLPDIADQPSGEARLRSVFPELELFSSDYGNTELKEPVSNEILEACEGSLGMKFPEVYRDFVRATDGMLLGETLILGCNESVQLGRKFEFATSPNLVVAFDVENSICDGVWHIPLVENRFGHVFRKNNLGELDPVRLPFDEFLKRSIREAQRTDVEIAAIRKQRSLADVPRGYSVVARYGSAARSAATILKLPGDG